MEAIKEWFLVNDVYCFAGAVIVLLILLISILVYIHSVKERLEDLAWVEEDAYEEIARYKHDMYMYKDEYERIAKVHDLDVASLTNEIKQLKAENKLLKKKLEEK